MAILTTSTVVTIISIITGIAHRTVLTIITVLTILTIMPDNPVSIFIIIIMVTAVTIITVVKVHEGETFGGGSMGGRWENPLLLRVKRKLAFRVNETDCVFSKLPLKLHTILP